jgi:hypothetical protein
VACIVDASPAHFNWDFDEKVPIVRVSYRFRQLDGPPLFQEILRLL